MFPELDLCYTDPVQRLITAGYDLDYLQWIVIYLMHVLFVRRAAV